MKVENPRKVFALVAALVCSTLSLSAQPTEAITTGDILINALAPGWVQLKAGNPEGWFLLSGTALLATGSVSMALSSAPTDSSTGAQLFSGDWGLKLGMLEYDIGGAQWFYSIYNYQSTLAGRPSLDVAETLLSPFSPDVVLSPEVLPVVLLETGEMTFAQLATWSHILAENPEVPGLQTEGWPMSAMDAVIGCTAGYAEELAFHGFLQPALIERGLPEQTAVGITAAFFGLGHLGNMIFGLPRTEEDWLNYLGQATITTIVGWYNGELALEGPVGLRKAIAVHSLHNLLYAFSNQLVRSESNRARNGASKGLSFEVGPAGILAIARL